MAFNQVNKAACKRLFINYVSRSLLGDTSPTLACLHPLENRKLIKIKGQDVTPFLQGLITNDMRHFETGANSMYAMFLNNKGRILYDTLIHKLPEQDSYLIECDKFIVTILQKYLQIFKLRRNIEIEDFNKDFRSLALVPSQDATVELKSDNTGDIKIYKDPRLHDLGYRVIAPTSLDHNELAVTLGANITVHEDDNEYKYLRYKLGVSEGSEELHPGTCFPLEANCDYLHGVNFHKGCYVGQELTARTHHTGVVRKRIMPLKFEQEIKEDIEKDTAVFIDGNSKKNIGKIKGVMKDYGLGLIRTKEALETGSLVVGSHKAEALKPTWWPVESPKEILKTD